MRKQLFTKNTKSNEGIQEKNGGVKRIDGRGSAEELDRETGEVTLGRTQDTIERMAEMNRLPQRAEECHEEGRRRRGSPWLRWADCVKRDVKKAG